MLWGARTAASRQRAFGREPEFGEAEPAPGGRTIRGDQGHLILGQRIASQSEVIRAIVSGDRPCCGVPAPPPARPPAGPAPATIGYGRPRPGAWPRSPGTGGKAQLSVG